MFFSTKCLYGVQCEVKSKLISNSIFHCHRLCFVFFFPQADYRDAVRQNSPIMRLILGKKLKSVIVVVWMGSIFLVVVSHLDLETRHAQVLNLCATVGGDKWLDCPVKEKRGKGTDGNEQDLLYTTMKPNNNGERKHKYNDKVTKPDKEDISKWIPHLPNMNHPKQYQSDKVLHTLRPNWVSEVTSAL